MDLKKIDQGGLHEADGALPCPDCEGLLPKVMLKRRSYTDRDGEHLPIYEVGCLACPNGSRASTPERALELWNAKKFIPKPIK